MAFSLAVVHYCRTLPRDFEGNVFRGQLLRSGTGVGANYRAAGYGRSGREWRSKLTTAVEEADECEFWLTLLDAIDLGDAVQRAALHKESSELARALAASIRTHKRNEGGSSAV